ncbi:hypothetical protein D8S78_22540 [Natrialba swarupiae]|nr:hypothetical protein [Natrialba swarupiae]
MPTKLCRLTWTGDPDSWGFAFYKYSDDRYEPSISLDGSFAGSPESCFDTAAQLYPIGSATGYEFTGRSTQYRPKRRLMSKISHPHTVSPISAGLGRHSVSSQRSSVRFSSDPRFDESVRPSRLSALSVVSSRHLRRRSLRWCPVRLRFDRRLRPRSLARRSTPRGRCAGDYPETDRTPIGPRPTRSAVWLHRPLEKRGLSDPIGAVVRSGIDRHTAKCSGTVVSSKISASGSMSSNSSSSPRSGASTTVFLDEHLPDLVVVGRFMHFSRLVSPFW